VNEALNTPAESPSPESTPDLAPIPVYNPYLGPEVQLAAMSALEAGWLGMGKLSQEFELGIDRFLELDGRQSVSTNSCTEALHLAARLIGLGPGDEVIAPAFTYVAGHQAMTRTGASIVFCDIDPVTLCIDPVKVRELITPATKAVLVVDYLGFPCDLDAILEIAQEHGLRVIEDAAHAFGTRDSKGRMVGSFGDITCFSFGPVKTITTLEGGAIITSDLADVQTLHELRHLGIDSDTEARYKNQRNWEFDVVRQGYRCHLGSVPAAIGLSQLRMIDEFIANREEYCRRYDRGLAGVPGVQLFETDWAGIAPYIYVIRVDGDQRAGLMAHLKERGISSGIHFLGANEFSFYADSRRGDLSVTEQVTQRVLTLPLHSYMDDATIDRVIDAVKSYFA
jgi:dTDP-4-amino-4,6-dideoxygalactose transaminase